MQGPELKLSPARPDAGEYELTLTATDGAESQSVSLGVVVHRDNSPPRWFGRLDMTSLLDDSGLRRDSCPGLFRNCTVHGTLKVWIDACDPEGDRITLDVEVVPLGQPLTKVPTHSITVPSGYNWIPDQTCPHTELVAELTGLKAEQSYQFALRVSDELGAVAKFPWAPDGWLHDDSFTFDQGPCTDRQCACVMPGVRVNCDFDPGMCCSGSCKVGPTWGSSTCL